MKIISWNCNGAFRKKVQLFSPYNADYYVIQECENPKKFPFPDDFITLYRAVWTGLSDRRGLAVFVNHKHAISGIYSKFQSIHDIIVLKSEQQTLLGVWTHKPNYIEDLYDFTVNYGNILNQNTIIVGDFNSNSIWDKSHGAKSHSCVVENLREKGLSSVWHTLNREVHGNESVATLFFHKNLNQPFHIDYCFAHKNIMQSISVGKFHEWIAYSDHMPLTITLQDKDGI